MLKDLKLNGFSFDEDITMGLDAVSYTDIENEDNWIELVADSEDNERTILIFYKRCSAVFFTTFVNATEHEDIEKYINERIKRFYVDD